MIDDFESAVQSIMAATHCDRAKAEVTARLNGWTPASPDPAAERDANVLEKTEQLEVQKVFRAFGFDVYWLSQARATKQTPGIPDLWCMHRELAIAFWWETKRQIGGRHSTPQRKFAEHCTRCNVGYGTGDRFAAAERLIALGIAYRLHGALDPVRAPSGPSTAVTKV